jgi:hypothetical protein
MASRYNIGKDENRYLFIRWSVERVATDLRTSLNATLTAEMVSLIYMTQNEAMHSMTSASPRYTL